METRVWRLRDENSSGCGGGDLSKTSAAKNSPQVILLREPLTSPISNLIRCVGVARMRPSTTTTSSFSNLPARHCSGDVLIHHRPRISLAARRAEREKRRQVDVGLYEGILKVKGRANLDIDVEDELLLRRRRDIEKVKTSSAAATATTRGTRRSYSGGPAKVKRNGKREREARAGGGRRMERERIICGFHTFFSVCV